MGVFAFKLSNAASKSTRVNKLAEKSNLRILAVRPPDSPHADAEGRAPAVMQGGSDAYMGRPAEGRND